MHITCRTGREPHHAELNRVLGEVILIQEAVQLALALALAQTAHRAIHSLGVLPPPEIRVGDDQADRHLGGSPVPSSRREPRRLRARRSPAIGGGDQRAEDHEDLDPHLSSSSFLPFFSPSLRRIGKFSFFPRSFSSSQLCRRCNADKLFFFFFYFDFISIRSTRMGRR